MDFFDYAWSTSFQITRKKHEEVKILLQDNSPSPMLKKDSYGYVICLTKPKKTNTGKTYYQGTVFNPDDDFLKKLIWRNFKASVFHLSMHAAISDFELYAKWAKDKDLNLAVYIASLLEDAIINAYLKALWIPFLYDVAFANTLSYLRLKPSGALQEDISKIMVSILSKSTVGLKENLSEKMQKDIDEVCLLLRETENLAYQEICSKKKEEENNKNATIFLTVPFEIEKRIDVGDKIYNRLHEYGAVSHVPSLLYTESHGNNLMFYESCIPSKDDVEKILPYTLSELGIQMKDDASQTLTSQYDEAEISQVFPMWEAKESAQQKILSNYRALSNSTRFSSFEFSNEDLTEYTRCRNFLSSSIRRILELLRGIKNISGEDYRLESGLVDLQEAIQVIASKSQRSDIFSRDELQKREEAWAILIDASHSLNFFTGEVRGIALCLSEVAKGLFFTADAWSMFAFNDKFYVIKDFSEPFTNHVRARIGGLKHGGLTYLPDGLTLATEALKRCREESRVLVVVSDFFPSGYENVERELEEKIKKVERSGIGLIGIGVNSQAVKKYFRINCVVENPFELMKKFVKAFLEYSSTAM